MVSWLRNWVSLAKLRISTDEVGVTAAQWRPRSRIWTATYCSLIGSPAGCLSRVERAVTCIAWSTKCDGEDANRTRVGFYVGLISQYETLASDKGLGCPAIEADDMR